MRHVKCILGIAAAVVLGSWHLAAQGQVTSASATGTVQQLSPTLYQYNVTLNNTGSTPIESFWFAWFPGYDLLPHIPSNISAPTGWSGTHMEEGFVGVSSVLWTTTTTPLQPGQSLSGLTFESSDSPDVMQARSQFFPTFATDYSYVYAGAPELSAAGVLTPSPFVTVTPEPGCLLLVPAVLLLVQRRRA